MRLYLDSCCFNRPFDDQQMLTIRLETEAKLHIQADIRNGKYNLGWSYVLNYENGANPIGERRTEIQRWEEIADSFTTETPAILNRMNEIIKTGIKPLDALHIACAETMNCEYFLTVDKGILKKAKAISGIAILSPVDFVIREGA